MNEASMARFLGLAPKAKPTCITRGLVVVYTARCANGSYTRFVHRSNTISTLEAQIDAKKAMRKKKMTPHALLEISPPDQAIFAM